MNHLRYCLVEEVRRQDLERNVAQYRLVKQVCKIETVTDGHSWRQGRMSQPANRLELQEGSGI